MAVRRPSSGEVADTPSFPAPKGHVVSMMRLSALVLLLALPCAAHGLEHSARDFPEYTLHVAIDIRLPPSKASRQSLS